MNRHIGFKQAYHKDSKSGFVLIETLQGLVLCAFALSLCFALLPYMSHKFALTQINFASGALYPQILLAPSSDIEIRSANKIFVFSHHTFERQDMALPFSLSYLQIKSVH